MISNVDEQTIQRRYPDLLEDWTDGDLIELLHQQVLDAEADIPGSTPSHLVERVVSALVAHRMRLHLESADGDHGAQNPISKVSAGGVSVDYVLPTPPEGTLPEYMHFYTTRYGVDYLNLMRRVVGGGPRLACI